MLAYDASTLPTTYPPIAPAKSCFYRAKSPFVRSNTINHEHYKLLTEQGVTAWNRWRRENPKVVPNLSDANLTEVDLTEANLTNAILIQTNLTGAKLNGANLFVTNLTGVDLTEANLTGVDLKDTIIEPSAIDDTAVKTLIPFNRINQRTRKVINAYLDEITVADQ